VNGIVIGGHGQTPRARAVRAQPRRREGGPKTRAPAATAGAIRQLFVRFTGRRARTRKRGGNPISLEVRVGWLVERLACGDARDIGAIDADIGEFAVRQLREFPQVAMIVLEGLNRAKDAEQHGLGSLSPDGSESHRWNLYKATLRAAAEAMLRCS
jgi:hypothetical protein